MITMKMIAIIGLFAVLLLSGCSKQLVGNDKDIHGCIGSAGYSWCEEKQKCLRVWEENCSTGTVDTCQDANGNSLALDEALTIAKSSECGDRIVIDCSCPEGFRKDGDACNPECYYSTPKCLMPSRMCENTYFCNEGTGTYWFDLSITREGCSPACVVDVAAKTASINWRCTGLVVPE